MYNTGAPLGTIARHLRFYLRRHHTSRRVWNLVRTLRSLITRPIHAPNMPISLKIDPSATCQLSCKGCLQSKPEFKARTRGNIMNMNTFDLLLDQADNHLYRIQFYYDGEPFMNRHLLEMIAKASQRGVGSQVSTNFSFQKSDVFYRDVVESGLEHLIISMDGTDAETYSKYRINGRFDLVDYGMREVLKWKRKLKSQFPIVEWQFIIFEHNRHQVDKAKELAREIGVDRLCLKYDGYSDPATWDAKSQRTEFLSRRLIRLNSCLWLWGALAIGWDGVVNPCCMNYPIGDLKKTPLHEIWNSEGIKELRRFVRRPAAERDNSDFVSLPCKGCRFIM